MLGWEMLVFSFLKMWQDAPAFFISNYTATMTVVSLLSRFDALYVADFVDPVEIVLAVDAV